jgi:type 1 glutamine amidotransferase
MKWMTGLAALLAPAAASAAPVIDCPNRDAPYSLESPLIDLLLNDSAKAVIERHLPGAIAKMPPTFASTKAPSFASILTFSKLTGLFGAKDVDLGKVQADLNAIPVTAADRLARCERYDNDRPSLTLSKGGKGKPRVLLFQKMTGFRDGPSVEAASGMISALAARHGWALAVTDKGGAINPGDLAKFDVVIWNNVSGDVLTLAQRQAFRRWMERGGGFVGMHGTGGDPVYFWDWYADTLLGARFTGHPSDPQFQDATVRIEATPSGIGSNLPAMFTMNEEWYSFEKSARLAGAHVIATLDESTYKQAGRFGTNITMGADHPIAWTRCLGNGRSFYSAIGHRPENYSDSRQITLVEQAVDWAAGKGKSRCVAGREVAVSRP